MFGWHHQLNGRESEQAPGNGEGQQSLVHCSPWGHKESDTTEQLNNQILTVRKAGKFYLAQTQLLCSSKLPKREQRKNI